MEAKEGYFLEADIDTPPKSTINVEEEITRIEPSAKKGFLFIGTSYGRIIELKSENF